MQLPEALCSFQQVLSFILYSLRIEDMQGRFVMHAGPFSNLTSCIMRRLIEPDLKESESYTLTVVVGTKSQNITSYKDSFSKSIRFCIACTTTKVHQDKARRIILHIICEHWAIHLARSIDSYVLEEIFGIYRVWCFYQISRFPISILQWCNIYYDCYKSLHRYFSCWSCSHKMQRTKR